MSITKVLLVDSSSADISSIRTSVAHHHSADYEITSCHCFSIAQDYLDANEFSIILIAIRPHELHQAELFFKSIQAKAKDAALIIMSHQIDRAVTRQYMQAGADNVVLHQKIMENPADLIDALELALARKKSQADRLRKARLDFEREYLDDKKNQEISSTDRLNSAHRDESARVRSVQTVAAATLREALDAAAAVLKKEQEDRAAELKHTQLLHLVELKLLEQDKQDYINNYQQMFFWMHGGYMVQPTDPVPSGLDMAGSFDKQQTEADALLKQQQEAAASRKKENSEIAENTRYEEERDEVMVLEKHKQESVQLQALNLAHAVLKNQKPDEDQR